MDKSKIEMKLEAETKDIKKICETLVGEVEHQLSKGVEQIDAKEMGEVIDMIKDLYEAKEKMVKACYYEQIMEAMEEHDFEDEEDIMDDGRRGYRGQPRSKSSGRYMSRGDGRRSNRGRRGYDEPMGDYEMTPEMYRMYSPEYYRDMDRMDGKLYYTSNSSSGMSSQGGSMGGSQGGSRGYSEGRDSREGRSGQSRKSYMETKEMHKGNTPEDKEAKKKELDKWMTDIGSDIKELVHDMSSEEKTVAKQKLTNLANSLV